MAQVTIPEEVTTAMEVSGLDDHDALVNGDHIGTDQSVGDQKVIAKFLVSNVAAGSVIGKAGSNISEFQTQSSARIQLSRITELFPGTNDRIMVISGSVNQVLTALHLVLAKMTGEKGVMETMMARDGVSQELSLLVPSVLCGSIIGKGGVTIRSFSEDSKAQIGLSPVDEMPSGVNDRVVRITADDVEQLMRAVALIITKLSENPNYSRYVNSAVSYPPSSSNGGNTNGGRGRGGSRGAERGGDEQVVDTSGPQDEVVMQVADRSVGAVIGKGGEVINQLKSLVGVRIKISSRTEFVEGTRDRTITISGPIAAVQIAEKLIEQKIAAAVIRDE